MLTVGTLVLTTNPRITVAVERNKWTLVIKNASIADQGQYMCQVSTVPPEKQFGSLIIQGIYTKISIVYFYFLGYKMCYRT